MAHEISKSNGTVTVKGDNGKIATNYSERGKQAPEPAKTIQSSNVEEVTREPLSTVEEAHLKFVEATEAPLMLDLLSEDITIAFNKFSQVYAKYVRVHALKVRTGIEITTILDNGTTETVNVSQEGDYLVTNPGGEQYLINSEKFKSRYIPTEKEYIYQANGSARVFINPTGKPIKIMAPWGAEQFGDAECLLATTYDPKNPEAIGNDRYIIGREEFLDTYGNLKLEIPESLLSQGKPTAESKRDKAVFQNDNWMNLIWTDHLRRKADFRKNLEKEMLVKYGSIKATNNVMSREIRSALDDFEWEENRRFKDITEAYKSRGNEIQAQYRLDEANQSLARSRR